MVKHGMAKKTKLYGVWKAMKQRCSNPNNKDYYDYGGRGITVCESWKKDYLEFHNWAYDNGYEEGLTLDRIDVNDGYKPSNCIWATMAKQANNKRNTIRVEVEDTLYTLTELSNIYGIDRNIIEARYYRGDRGLRLVRSVRRISA